MKIFLPRLLQAIEDSKFRETSYRKISIAADLGPNFLSNLVNNEAILNSKVGPGFFSVCRLCELLNTTPNHLAGLDTSEISSYSAESPSNLQVLKTLTAAQSAVEQIEGPPSVDQLISLYARSGGRIEAFKSVLEFTDLYEVPSSDSPYITVSRLGTKSLAAMTLAVESKEVLQVALSEVADGDLKQKLVADYLEAGKKGVLLTYEELVAQLPNKPQRVKLDYTRILLKLSDASGNTHIMNYSKLL